MYLSCAGFDSDISRSAQFTFPPSEESKPKFASGSFTIVKDDIYEYDELIVAEFEFDQRIATAYNTIKGQPNMTYILIKDDDSE